jgi:hypothetical protein
VEDVVVIPEKDDSVSDHELAFDPDPLATDDQNPDLLGQQFRLGISGRVGGKRNEEREGESEKDGWLPDERFPDYAGFLLRTSGPPPHLSGGESHRVDLLDVSRVTFINDFGRGNPELWRGRVCDDCGVAI